MGWTQEEIAANAEISQQAIGGRLQPFSELKKVVMGQFSRGLSIREIAKTEGVHDKLIEALLLQDKADRERFDYLKIGIQPYNVWNFSGRDPRC